MPMFHPSAETAVPGTAVSPTCRIDLDLVKRRHGHRIPALEADGRVVGGEGVGVEGERDQVAVADGSDRRVRVTSGELREDAYRPDLRGAARLAAGRGVVEGVPRSPDLGVPLGQRVWAEQALAEVADGLDGQPVVLGDRLRRLKRAGVGAR